MDEGLNLSRVGNMAPSKGGVMAPLKSAKNGSQTVLRMGVFGSFCNGVVGGFWEWPQGAETLTLQDKSIGTVA